MYLQVNNPGGSKYWWLKDRVAGREKELAMGIYPDMSIAAARERRDEARALHKEARTRPPNARP